MSGFFLLCMDECLKSPAAAEAHLLYFRASRGRTDTNDQLVGPRKQDDNDELGNWFKVVHVQHPCALLSCLRQQLLKTPWIIS